MKLLVLIAPETKKEYLILGNFIALNQKSSLGKKMLLSTREDLVMDEYSKQSVNTYPKIS